MLEGFLGDPHPAVRAEALAGLRRLHSAGAGCALAEGGVGLARWEPQPSARAEGRLARGALAAVVSAAGDASPHVRAEALPLLCLAGCTGVRAGEAGGGGGIVPAGSDTFAALCNLAGDPDRGIRVMACRALGCPLVGVDPAMLADSLRGVRVLDGVRGTFALALDDACAEVRSAAVGALRELGLRDGAPEAVIARVVAFLVRPPFASCTFSSRSLPASLPALLPPPSARAPLQSNRHPGPTSVAQGA